MCISSLLIAVVDWTDPVWSAMAIMDQSVEVTSRPRGSRRVETRSTGFLLALHAGTRTSPDTTCLAIPQISDSPRLVKRITFKLTQTWEIDLSGRPVTQACSHYANPFIWKWTAREPLLWILQPKFERRLCISDYSTAAFPLQRMKYLQWYATSSSPSLLAH